MTYRLTILTDYDRDLVVESLRSSADQRVRVARKASTSVADDKRAGKDVRSAAVKLTALLAEADVLEGLATELAAAPEVNLLADVPLVVAGAAIAAGERLEVQGIPIDPADIVDDGTSKAAQELAALAGLEAAIIVEDPLTGALPEDEPAADQIEEAIK